MMNLRMALVSPPKVPVIIPAKKLKKNKEMKVNLPRQRRREKEDQIAI